MSLSLFIYFAVVGLFLPWNWSTVNNVALNILLHVFWCIDVFLFWGGYIPRHGIPGS